MILQKDFVKRKMIDLSKKDEIEIIEDVENKFEAFDQNGNLYIYKYDEFLRDYNDLDDRIYFPNDLKDKYYCEEIKRFIYDNVDRNALMCLNKMFFIRDDKDLEELVQYSGDEYGYEIMSDDEFGKTWVEKSIILINIKNLENEIAFNYSELQRQIMITILHEFRHLVLECNVIFLKFVLKEEYLLEERTEDSVEMYAMNEYFKIRKMYVFIKQENDFVNKIL